VGDEEQFKDAYRRIIDAISRGDPSGLDELIAPDVVDHNPIPEQAPGLDGFKQWMATARATFADMRGTVE
jgi:ketosteroid isomerase-like protein